MVIGILLFFCIIIAGYGIYSVIKAKQIQVIKQHQQEQIDQINKKINDLKLAQKILQNSNNTLNQQKEQKIKEIQQLNLNISIKRREVEKDYTIEKQLIDSKLKDYQERTQQAANNYIDTLQKDYERAEAAHKQQITKLQVAYNAAAADLKVISETRKAAYQALLKERQIKQNQDNYRLKPSRNDLQDIHTLEHIKSGLHKPRILSMLIWQTYWQPIAKKQFPIILQDKTKTGIYKITNIHTDQSYIGQSLNIYKRWCDHCKAGLGIDTPIGNKLYKAMQDQGLQNFTFELLCECKKEELDEKQLYFIDLYQADTFGYNSTKGNKRL